MAPRVLKVVATGQARAARVARAARTAKAVMATIAIVARPVRVAVGGFCCLLGSG